MDYTAFLQEWQGRRVDFTRDGVYSADDLISEYLFQTQNVTFELNGASLETLYSYVPDDLMGTLYQVQDPTPKQGDIVFLQGYTHWGVASGEQDTNRFEMLEQNAVGSGSGEGDDAIRLNYYPKDQLHGVWRMRVVAIMKPKPVPVLTGEEQKIQDDVLELEPKVARAYRPPTGALKVPLAIQRILVKVELDTYPSPGLASQRLKATGKTLKPGMCEFDLLKHGMLRVANVSPEQWINPVDNVEKPKIRPAQLDYKGELNGAKEAEENYHDYLNSAGQWQEHYLTAKQGGAFQIHFETGRTATMPAGYHVFCAGETVVDDSIYVISTKCFVDDNNQDRPKPIWIGIRKSDLFDDGTYDTRVSFEEKKALNNLRPTDYINLGKAKIQKKFMDIRSK